MDTVFLALLVRPFAILALFVCIVIPLELVILRIVPRRIAFHLSRPVSDCARWMATLAILIALGMYVSYSTG